MSAAAHFDQPATDIVPRLTTARLVLRQLRASDFDAYAAFMADADGTKHLGGAVDRRTAFSFFLALCGGWIATGAGWWAVTLPDDRIVGTVGVFFRETSLDKGPDAELEIGWTIFRDAWGKKYAVEAARAALAAAIGRHGRRRVIAFIDPGNVASARVAEALGMTFEGAVEFYGEPSTRWFLPAGS